MKYYPIGVHQIDGQTVEVKKSNKLCIMGEIECMHYSRTAGECAIEGEECCCPNQREDNQHVIYVKK